MGKLNIRPEDLAAAAGKAAKTATASTVAGVVPPPPTVTSALDGAAVACSAAGEALRGALDSADGVVAAEQAAMFATSPQELVAQDEQGAASMESSTPAVIAPEVMAV